MKKKKITTEDVVLSSLGFTKEEADKFLSSDNNEKEKLLMNIPKDLAKPISLKDFNDYVKKLNNS